MVHPPALLNSLFFTIILYVFNASVYISLAKYTLARLKRTLNKKKKKKVINGGKTQCSQKSTYKRWIVDKHLLFWECIYSGKWGGLDKCKKKSHITKGDKIWCKIFFKNQQKEEDNEYSFRELNYYILFYLECS